MAAGRILVTGATGFVGRRVAPALREAGHPLTLAVRGSARGAADPSDRVVQVGPLGPATPWAEALRDVATVVHLAGHVHVAPERAGAEAALFDTVNHLASARLFDEAARAGASLFVFVSTTAVLGDETRGRPFDDAAAPAPETHYGRSKLAAEDALRAKAAGSATRLVVLRPPLVCGPGVGGNLGSLARLAAWPLPWPLEGIDNRRTLLSIDNLASALAAVVSRPVPGTFLLGDRATLSTSAIVRHLREGAGIGGPLLPAPAALLRRVAALLGRAGQARRLLGDLVVSSESFRRAYGWTDVVDTPVALRATGAAARRRG